MMMEPETAIRAHFLVLEDSDFNFGIKKEERKENFVSEVV